VVRDECGIWRFPDVEAAAYRDAAALVTAAATGDMEMFDSLFPVSYAVLYPLVEALSEAMHLLATDDEPEAEVLARFCRGMNQAAEQAEAR